MQKKYSILIALSFCISVLCSGCVKMHSANPDNGYSTDFALSATEYTLFLNKQIGVVSNQLLTRMSVGESVVRGEYESSKEIENANESLSKLESAKTEIVVTMPATNYESDRESTMNLVEDAIVAMTSYRDALENSDMSRVSSSIVEMKTCFIALGGEGNNYYE